MTYCPKVITELLAVDDTGTVANYIRQLEREMAALREVIVRADSCLSLLWHRCVPPERKDTDLRFSIERTIGDLRRLAAHPPPTPEDR